MQVEHNEHSHHEPSSDPYDPLEELHTSDAYADRRWRAIPKQMILSARAGVFRQKRNLQFSDPEKNSKYHEVRERFNRADEEIYKTTAATCVTLVVFAATPPEAGILRPFPAIIFAGNTLYRAIRLYGRQNEAEQYLEDNPY